MRTQEVIISAPERNAVYCTAIRTVTAGDTIRFPERTVQAFDHLFEWPEFFGYFVVIGKGDHLRDEYVPAFSILNCWAASGYALYPSAMNFRALPGNSLNLSKAMRMVRMQGPTSLEVET